MNSLFGGSRLLEVPQLEGLVLGGRDQDRLHRVEGQTADRVEVAPQGELRVPGLPQSVFAIGDLREESRKQILGVSLREGSVRFESTVARCCSSVALTSYARLSASLATVSPASSPSPSSSETASSTLPRMKDFPDDGRKVMASEKTRSHL